MSLFGMQIPKKRENVPSWSECSKWCSTLGACKAWTYSTTHYTCTAKANNEERRAATGFVSGSRECKGVEGVKLKKPRTRNQGLKRPDIGSIWKILKGPNIEVRVYSKIIN